jgi:ATP-dependent exoDNAse (exonuclease V) beta subunit
MSQGLTGTCFKDEYLHEKGLMYVDNLNLLYVAFTRAIDALIVFAPDFKEEILKNNIATLIQQSLITQHFDIQNAQYPATMLPQYYNPELKLFEFGTLKPLKIIKSVKPGIQLNEMGYIVRKVSDVTRQVIPSYDYLGDDMKFVESRMNRGKIMHELLQYIRTIDDLESAITKLTMEGKLSGNDRESVKTLLLDALKNELAADWFSGKWDIKAEASILLPGGQMYRPDRVMLNGKQAIIVDYKFGEEETPSHTKQVATYMRYIQNMGYSNVKGWVWYIQRNKFIPVGAKPEQLTIF